MVVNQAQSLVIALRSPATKRGPPTLIEIHQIFTTGILGFGECIAPTHSASPHAGWKYLLSHKSTMGIYRSHATGSYQTTAMGLTGRNGATCAAF